MTFRSRSSGTKWEGLIVVNFDGPRGVPGEPIPALDPIVTSTTFRTTTSSEGLGGCVTGTGRSWGQPHGGYHHMAAPRSPGTIPGGHERHRSGRRPIHHDGSNRLTGYPRGRRFLRLAPRRCTTNKITSPDHHRLRLLQIVMARNICNGSRTTYAGAGRSS